MAILLEIQRKAGAGEWGTITTATFTDGKYTDTSELLPNTIYYYRSREVIDSVEGEWKATKIFCFTQLTQSLDYLVKTSRLVGYVADPIVNGGFETGDLTGWTYEHTGDIGYDLSYGDEHSGDHSFYIGGDDEGSFSLSQTRDLTGFKYIIFWSRFGGGNIHLRVDTDILITLDDGDSWVEHIIPISYSGSHKVEFYSDSIPSLIFDLDDVSLSPYLLLDYGVKKSSQLTKSLDYLTKVSPQLTKSLDYYVKVTTPLTESLDYEVKNILQLTKSLSYLVLGQTVSLTLSLDYLVKKSSQLTTSIDYEVKVVIPLELSLDYQVRPCYRVLLDLDYYVKVPNILTLSLSYRIPGQEAPEKVDLSDEERYALLVVELREVTFEIWR
jgi:hypothetical protein